MCGLQSCCLVRAMCRPAFHFHVLRHVAAGPADKTAQLAEPQAEEPEVPRNCHLLSDVGPCYLEHAGTLSHNSAAHC